MKWNGTYKKKGDRDAVYLVIRIITRKENSRKRTLEQKNITKRRQTDPYKGQACPPCLIRRLLQSCTRKTVPIYTSPALSEAHENNQPVFLIHARRLHLFILRQLPDC